MRKKELLNKIEELENTIDHLYGAIDSYRADLSTLETMYALKEEELAITEDKLSNVKQQREKLFTKSYNLDNELNYVKHIMRAIKVLSCNGISFNVSYEGLETILEIYTFDSDHNETVVRLKSTGWNIESEDGLNGMSIQGRWSVSSVDIELYSGDGIEYYLSNTRNVLEKC